MPCSWTRAAASGSSVGPGEAHHERAGLRVAGAVEPAVNVQAEAGRATQPLDLEPRVVTLRQLTHSASHGAVGGDRVVEVGRGYHLGQRVHRLHEEDVLP